MKPSHYPLLLSLILAPCLNAREAATAEVVVAKAVEAETQAAEPEAETPAAGETEQEKLAAINKLEAERLTSETNAMRAEITRLKMERELITEKLALESAQRQAAIQDAIAELEKQRDQLSREGEIAKIRAEKLTNDLKVVQTEASLEVTRLQNEITRIETTEKRSKYADFEPQYLETPLREDGTLVVSDRRIPLNGMIVSATADYVTSRIQYWNNKDRKLPIFIIIDDCPGGSVMAGYRILKSMESSEAPIHVVVKSFAASMAACITTLAEESYAYPNALILHHQISSQLQFARLNLTQQREFFEESNRWWERLATPVAQKMGISTDEFIKRMYERSSSGDWAEFADKAQQLKWVNHIVTGIDETSITKNPDIKATAATPPQTALAEEIDADGKPYVWLPRLNPKDVYFLYNPDSYYRMR
jgi:ATP-dependent Clp protease, protease subunit